ncbi:SMP-30/gluconolactonase/LRE family protein [Actinomadura viridis]|uniref:Sugar lactone lactonase YvrE n=1 Tax=Actinomadura viridis TaxID=58110 RepID=A0A931GQJ2_9ACTN|nr:SMP-30/gluconolactonase/LRE family protein [Actinomadura viridis]MBG6088594.1 sugar lactone lactonase YvrE [Actinomadura viridis]
MSSPTEIEIAVAAGAALGEGPTWDPAAGRLLWVDILGAEVHAYDPATGRDTVLLNTGQHVGAAKPRAGGGIVANLRDGVGLYEPGGAFRWLAELPEDGRRGNDAAVGPDGALWAGSMSYDARPGGGALRRVRPGGQVTVILDDVTIGNGIAWSPDERLMYYVDTPTGRVDVFDWDPATATPRGRRVFAEIPPPGEPDGLTVDAEGRVWVAVWGGGRVVCHAPSGAVDRVIEVPAPQTTACAFGGPDLRDLYITTAAVNTPPGGEHAGSLLVVPGAGQGLPAPAFPG